MKSKYAALEAKTTQTADDKVTIELVKEFFEKGGYEFMSQLE